MTRRGAFHEELEIKLQDCWSTIGPTLFELKNFIRRSNASRDRFLLEISPTNRTEIINTVWQMSKALLPFTMTENSYGLVGASKILFAVLPEIVLPVDNTQWKQFIQDSRSRRCYSFYGRRYSKMGEQHRPIPQSIR
jgi:hypothetical protein